MANDTTRTVSGARVETQDSWLIIGLVVFLFFAWGFATSLVDTLVPALKALFSLSYTEVMLTQFSVFIGYFIFSLPAGLVLSRIGYFRGVVLGLIVMMSGCLLFAPASALGIYIAFLLALFIMAAGMSMLQVAANPFIELLGPESTSHARLTLAQAFNSLGTVIGPLVGTVLILGGKLSLETCLAPAKQVAAAAPNQAHAVQLPFLIIAAVLAILAVIFWLMRNMLSPAVSGHAKLGAILALTNRPRLMLGALAIFTYVGAEVSIGSVMINYLMQPTVLGVTNKCGGGLLTLYWGGAMVGRFIGAFALRYVKPGHALAACAIGACALAATSSLSHGEMAAVSLLVVGLVNSIMFPTIFSLATEQLGPETPNGAGLLSTAIVGGAIIPVITGAVADATTLAVALLVPAICYIWIAVYGMLAARGLGLKDDASA